METNDRKKIRNDVILAVVLLCVAAAAMLFWHLQGTEGDFAVVLIDGVETARYALDSDTEVEITTDGGGTNTLVIRDGEAFVEAANCPEKAITVTNNLAAIDYDTCNGCGACVELCPVHCLKTADFSA